MRVSLERMGREDRYERVVGLCAPGIEDCTHWRVSFLYSSVEEGEEGRGGDKMLSRVRWFLFILFWFFTCFFILFI